VEYKSTLLEIREKVAFKAWKKDLKTKVIKQNYTGMLYCKQDMSYTLLNSIILF